MQNLFMRAYTHDADGIISLCRDHNDPCTRLVAFNETTVVMSDDEETDCQASSSADEWSQRRQQKENWSTLLLKWPSQMFRSMTAIHQIRMGSTVSSVATTKRSAMHNETSPKWRLSQKKHVRFKGMLSPWAITCIARFVTVFSEGSSMLFWWDTVTAFANAADFLILPLAALSREHVTARHEWAERYGMQAADYVVRKYSLWPKLELAFDAVFILDFAVRFARAWVLDMGFVCSTADRLVETALVPSIRNGGSRKKPAAIQYDLQGAQRFGAALQTQLFISIPLRTLLMLPMWVVHNRNDVSNMVLNSAALARSYRIFDLMSFFSSRQEDVAEDIQWIALCKFSYIVYATVRTCFSCQVASCTDAGDN